MLLALQRNLIFKILRITVICFKQSLRALLSDIQLVLSQIYQTMATNFIGSLTTKNLKHVGDLIFYDKSKTIYD